MEISIRPDGLMTEKSVEEVARWYSTSGDDELPDDQETFEAQLALLRTRMAITASRSGRRSTTLSSERYNVLRILYQAPGHRLPMGEIVTGLNVSPPSITKLVDGLSETGLARRVTDQDDKRRVSVELTDEGVHAVERILPSVRAATRRLWSGLTKREKRVLVHLLTKLSLSLQTASDDTLLG